eukprot:CAMPEP_0168321952 /NCGR_PEP_ID=MMETSP0213-20121227/2595_1 /TAXON_ID=151035 /ORGANISM="Euplotes harpa, Strain FSP1.4" /LENGTH=110 /DNA_ID=CAMNT_0008323737 /DNA_START=37 /DNA_END=366 /DNA_ORIENTATION=-
MDVYEMPVLRRAELGNNCLALALCRLSGLGFLALASVRMELDVAVVTAALRVVKTVGVLAVPGQLGPAALVVAGRTESFRVMLSVDVFAVRHELGRPRGLFLTVDSDVAW